MRALIIGVTLGLVAAALPVSAQSPLERGRYLVEVHGGLRELPHPEGPGRRPPGQAPRGGFQLDDSFGTWITPNITPDPETGIGRWTDEGVIRATREGRGRDGKTLGPPMPFDLYRRLSDNDVKAMVAYLRTVPAVRQAVPRSQYKIPLLIPTAARGRSPDPPRQDLVKYGEYLAEPGGALHGVPHPLSAGRRPDGTRLGAGGLPFHGRGG